jgi:hypothetical protein
VCALSFAVSGNETQLEKKIRPPRVANYVARIIAMQIMQRATTTAAAALSFQSFSLNFSLALASRCAVAVSQNNSAICHKSARRLSMFHLRRAF